MPLSIPVTAVPYEIVLTHLVSSHLTILILLNFRYMVKGRRVMVTADEDYYYANTLTKMNIILMKGVDIVIVAL